MPGPVDPDGAERLRLVYRAAGASCAGPPASRVPGGWSREAMEKNSDRVAARAWRVLACVRACVRAGPALSLSCGLAGRIFRAGKGVGGVRASRMGLGQSVC